MAEEEKANVEETGQLLVSDFDSLEYMLSKTDVDYEITEADDELSLTLSIYKYLSDYKEEVSFYFEFDPKTGSLEEVW